ncbi:MAG: MATE family efflux transporter, partial [Pseudomonadota bacterium]
MSASPSVQPPTIAEVLRLAWPASVAASVTPLLGTVDVWALARSDRPLDIAAVGLGSVIFSLVYWAFGFIRMSVAGLTAQASGAEDPREERASLARGVFIGGGLGLLLLLLQWPIGAAAFPLLALGSNASAETLAAAEAYYAARIWGAPFVIATYAAFGWLTAKGRTDALMTVSLAMTALNIALDYAFVVYFGWGAEGVAIGTLIAEVAGALFAGGYILSILRREGGASAHWASLDLWSRGAVMRTIAVNRDIFIRTLLLALSFAWFVQRGGAFGDVVLAANQVLLQLFLF